MPPADHQLRLDAIWDALDKDRRRIDTSWVGLERRCGLSQWYFAKARKRRDWPSTETISAVLAATGTVPAQFAADVDRYIASQGESDE